MSFPCVPRLSWQNCPSDWWVVFQTFHIVTLAIHFLTLLSYLIFLFLDHRLKSHRDSVTFRQYLGLLTTQIKLGVIGYSAVIIINHLSLVTPKPLLPIAVNEITFNLYNLGIFATLMLLVRHWAILPLSIDPHIKDYSQRARLVFYITILTATFLVFGSDVAMIVDSSTVEDVLTFQYLIWGFGCLLNGLLYGIFGYRLIQAVNQFSHLQLVEAGHHRLALKIKLIYYLYVIVSGPYALLYFVIVAVKSQPYLVWLVVYSFFNLAGILTALVLAPLI